MHSIVKKQFVQVDAPRPAQPSRAGRAAASRCEKGLRPLRIEGVVRAVEITCSCGETTVVELEYPEPNA
jgi:hypothetical protein